MAIELADPEPVRRGPATHPFQNDRVDHAIAQILRISSGHPCWPPPSQQVESELRRFGKRAAALLANGRDVIPKFIGIVRQPTVVRLMPELRPARTRVLALFLIRRRGLGRGARILIGPLEPEHQIDQLLFAELLQISAIHAGMDLEIAPHGKGVGKYLADA